MVCRSGFFMVFMPFMVKVVLGNAAMTTTRLALPNP